MSLIGDGCPTTHNGNGCSPPNPMKRFPYKVLIVIGSLIAFVLVCFPSTIEIWRFRMRGQAYYSQVGDACDDLIRKVSAAGYLTNAADYTLKTDKIETLPIVLRDLGPDYVTVRTNFVLIVIGHGWGSYNITWLQDEGGGSFGHLSLNCEGKGQVMFSKHKTF
jgi:hypothetical protein